MRYFKILEEIEEVELIWDWKMCQMDGVDKFEFRDLLTPPRAESLSSITP
jgi:hypothetical protein